ncbi:hypothetical protein J3F83DRAFT_755800 [Trichoderma novae-zelandiae]
MGQHHLPSHHQLFAALIPPSPLPARSELAGTADACGSVTDEPSFAEHSNWRRQLLTLHVIFPSLLLPALDLLDRGLVSRLVVANGAQKTTEAAAAAAAAAISHGINLNDGETESTDKHSASRIPSSEPVLDAADQIRMYAVQSAASTTSRRKRRAPQTPKTHAVHLDAWNCSCGGFALDAYSHYDAKSEDERPVLRDSPASVRRPGGLALDGRLASLEDFPCCKHLLACLLAENWRGTAGGHARDRYTTKEELAAVIGGP